MKKWVCLPIYTCTHHDLPLLRAGYNRSDNNTQCGGGGEGGGGGGGGGGGVWQDMHVGCYS